MSACRENMNVFRMVKNCFVRVGKYHDGRGYAIKRLFRLLMRDVWRFKYSREYLFHDSFGKYLNKFVICPVFGHRNVEWLSDGGCDTDRPRHHCFSCEREVDPGIDSIFERKE